MIHESILPKIKAGATVRVFETVKDGDKSRESRFEGVIIARKHGSEAGASFTVRATIAGEGVEKTIPLHSPLISKVEVMSSPKKVHRSKMYFVRNISRKALRRKTAVTADRLAKAKVAKVKKESDEPK